MKYILASASPRRRELLAQSGISFEIIPSNVEEKITKSAPHDIVMELASLKANDVYQNLVLSSHRNIHINSGKDPDISSAENLTVIGADTIVVYHDEILGKPADKAEAYDMLSLLANRTHQVYTGVSLIAQKEGRKLHRTFYEKTDVTFYPITKEDLHAYVESGDSLDKAGAYGIQGTFAIHVKCIHGDYNNVVGLPIGRLYQELNQLI